MSKQISSLHAAYQKALPLGIRTALGKTRNRMKSLAWKIQNLMPREDPEERLAKLKRKASAPGAYRNRLKKWQRLLRKKKTINVVFEVTGVSKWKADSLLRLMLKHPRFNPIVWVVPYPYWPPRPDVNQKDKEQCLAHFSRMGCKVVCHNSLNEFPADDKPDIVFPNEPYDNIYCHPRHAPAHNIRFCYLPYSFTCSYSPMSKNTLITNSSLFFFAENETSLLQSRELMDNKGVNGAATGHPMADAFLFPGENRPTAWKDCGGDMKKVIWAPHWTILAETNEWIYYGTFLDTAQIMLQLAEKYREKIQFAFKPHPLLYVTLCKHPQWGKDKTDAFYAKWQEMPNTQFEDGAYVDLFIQSDAMIHDSGSFIQEFLFADKPCMYLKYPGNEQTHSAMASDCMNAYQIGVTQEEIEEFLQMVLRGEDPKAGVRQHLREKYLIPPNGQSAAQNIIDCLLMQERHGSD